MSTLTVNSLEIAVRYMGIFYSGENLDELENIFLDTLVFEGPPYRFDSAMFR